MPSTWWNLENANSSMYILVLASELKNDTGQSQASTGQKGRGSKQGHGDSLAE